MPSFSHKNVRNFPRVTPHGCVNNSQSFLPDVWTMICVNNPDFNDIGREVFYNGAWEAWLTNHIVKAMLNYPGAVLLGERQKKSMCVVLNISFDKVKIDLQSTFTSLIFEKKSKFKFGQSYFMSN